MKKSIIILACGILAARTAFAQESQPTQLESLEQRTAALEASVQKTNRLTISGYVQTQYQWGQEAASLKVGSGGNENPEKSFDRIGVRRGRLKFTYDDGIASIVVQPDFTDAGLKLKDTYLSIKDPWFNSMALKAGLFDRPFGFEVAYSSSRLESPERSTIVQTLFPDEIDLGAMLLLQAPKTSPWSILKLEGGLFGGNGVKPDTDNKHDFIGHLSASKAIDNTMSLSGGVSLYEGFIFQGNENVYKVVDGAFECNSDAANKGKYAKRDYLGFDAQFAISTAMGMTQLRGEYISGQQPGTVNSTKSPNADLRPTGDTYIRKINGGYAILVQDLGPVPVSLVAKYDWYNPNTQVSGNSVDSNKGFSGVDLKMSTIGLGAFWRVSNAVRLTAYYEINKNETSDNISGWEKDRKDNVFTLRAQVKF